MLQGYRENTKSKGGYSNKSLQPFSISAKRVINRVRGGKKYPCLLADKPLTFKVRDIIYHGKQLASNNPQWEIIGLMVTEENVLHKHRWEKISNTWKDLWTLPILSRDTKTNVACFSMTSCMFLQGVEMQCFSKPWHGQYAASRGGQKKTGREEGRVIFADGGWQQQRGWMLPELKHSAGCQRDITRSWEWHSLHTTGGAMQKKTGISITVNTLRNKSARCVF